MMVPWLQGTWDRLQQQRAGNRLPHAVLLTGRAGLGKRQFARLLARSLLCERVADDGLPCGACRACELSGAGSHPDFRLLAPEADSKVIRIDQIRALVDFFSLTSQYAGSKVALITPADVMNVAAANSLLKTLEEPPPRSLIILVTEHPSALPATIRSRCQIYRCPQPTRPQARQWLAKQLPQAEDIDRLLNLSGDAPLQSLVLAGNTDLEMRTEVFAKFAAISRRQQDPLRAAEDWSKAGISGPLHWLQGWAADMIRLRQAGAETVIRNADLRADLQRLAETVDLKALHDWHDAVAQAIRLAATSANDQMIVEDVLLGWIKVSNRQADKRKSFAENRT